jgi:hypothetical protein
MKVAFPHNLTEMMQTNVSAKAAKAAKIQAREDDIAKKNWTNLNSGAPAVQ